MIQQLLFDDGPRELSRAVARLGSRTTLPFKPLPLLRSLLTAVFLLGSLTAAAAPRIWFVNNNASDGDGSMSTPFASIAKAVEDSSAGDVIYVFRGSGPYRERVALRENQLLAGHGAAIAAQLASRGIAVPAGLPDLAAPPTIDGEHGDAVELTTGSSVIGVKLHSVSARALVVLNAGGNIFITDVALETSKGVAVAIEGGDANIELLRSPLTAQSGSALTIRRRTGGAIHFRQGSTITVINGVSEGVALEQNQGEYSFDEPLRLKTAGSRALVVRSSSRVTMNASESTITTVDATAVDIADTGIAIYLKSISATGGLRGVARGISIENAPGTFRVDGGALRNIGARGVSIVRSSGVTLQDLVIEKTAALAKATPPCSNLSEEKELDCGASVYLSDATDVLLRNVKISSSGQAGIFGDRVTGLTLDRVAVENAGDEAGEHGIVIRGLHGRSTITDSSVKDSASRQLFILNRDGEGTLEIHKSRFDGVPSGNGQQGVLVELANDAKFSLAIDDSDFVEHYSDAVHVLPGGKSQLELFVNNSRFAGSGSAIHLGGSAESRLQYRIQNNRIRGATGAAINVNVAFSSGTSSGTISGNTIGESGVAGSGAKCGTCSGISVVATRGGSLQTTIRENTIRQVDGYGIRVNARGTSNVAAIISGNTIAEPHGKDVLQAIAMQAGAGSKDTARLCADVSANRITGAWDAQGGGNAIAASARGNAILAFAGVDPGATAASVTNGLAVRNNAAKSNVSGSIEAAKSCF